MASSNPRSSDFSYKKYSLEQLDNWVNDALNCEDLTPEDIYDTILKCVDESVEYHKTYLTKSIELLSLFKGHRSFEIDTSLDDIDASYNAAIKERAYYEGWYYTATGEKFPRVTEATQKDWNDFWEEHYYPEEHEKAVYTEEELDAMCDAAAKQEERDKCREYNLREAEYYNQRALIDAQYNKKLQEEISRNDPNRLKYEDGWVYESPDGGKTVTRRRVGSLEKEIVKSDGYSTSERKHWTLPVEEIENGDTMETEYFITFPGDLLEAANLKEGDTIEWVDRGDGSYEMRKVTQPLQMDEC